MMKENRNLTGLQLATLVVFFFLAISFNVNAFQDDLSSPKSSVEYLKKYTSKEHGDEKKASMLIASELLPADSEREKYIGDIRKILDTYKYDWSVPPTADSTNYIGDDSSSVYLLLPKIFLEKQENKWLISKQTIDSIPNLLIEAKLKLEKEKKKTTLKPQLVKRAKLPFRKKKKKKLIRLDLSSPRSLMVEFSEYMSKDNWHPEIAQQIIHSKYLTRLEKRIDRVSKLNRFMEAKGIIINYAEIPNDPYYIDTMHLGAYEYTLTPRFAELYLEKIGGRWYVSKETVDKIPQLFEEAYPFGSDKLLKYLPSDKKTYLGLMAWQYIAILLLILVSFIFNKLLSWAAHYLIVHILFKLKRKTLGISYIKPVVRSFSLMIALLAITMFLPILQLPIKIAHYLTLIFTALIPLLGTIGAYYMTDIIALYSEKIAQKTKSSLDNQLVPLFRKVVKIFIIIIGSIYVLANLNIQLIPLITTLSIGGLAFALAAQGMIKNFFGSLMIFVDKPFQVGQWITASGVDGTVEKVGIRSTRVRTFTNSLTYVPNGKLADAVIDNHGLRLYRRFSTDLTITYDTPLNTTEVFIQGLRKIVKDHPKTRKDQYHIYMNNLSSHSLDIKFYIFFIVSTWSEELEARHEIISSILKLANELKVNFAFPTQTLYMQNPSKENPSEIS